jgi:hypothetical protein
MPDTPRLLRGAAEIGDVLGTSPAAAQALHQQGLIPTWKVGGTPYATEAGLRDWLTLRAAGHASCHRQQVPLPVARGNR